VGLWSLLSDHAACATQAVGELEREAARLQVLLRLACAGSRCVALCCRCRRRRAPSSPVTVRGEGQDNVRVVGDIQRSLVTIASAWHACLEHAAGHQPPP